MKKKIAIFALVAIFVSVGSITAQTKTVTKTVTKTTSVAKADKKSATPACCADKKSECCKGMTAAEKSKCVKKCNKSTAKTGTKTCTETKKEVTKKI